MNFWQEAFRRWFPPPGRLSRRGVLQLGTLALGGVCLPQLFQAQAAGSAGTLQGCIVIFLNGGPSHLDTWDMKPHAPEGIRGEFRPIPTSAPGIHICEHLSRTARWMHHGTLIRSMHHSVNNAHALAVYTALTGHDRGDVNTIVGASAEDHPNPGSVLAKLRPSHGDSLPYVALPYQTREGAKGPPQPGFFAGFLGKQYDPFWVLKDPNDPHFSIRELTLLEDISPRRLKQREKLLQRIDRLAQRLGPSGELTAFQHQALQLLLSGSVQKAFRIQEEPPQVRQAYGRNIYGQSVLLARRLIEVGTRVVTISWAPHANATWDTHGQNFRRLKKELLPQLDAALSALLQDLHDRGLLERTLVVVSGDFGRTPRVNKNAGRDHWNWCYSIALFGGGVRGGWVLGASDRIGAFPTRDAVTPGDVIATVYHLFGLDPHMELRDSLDRPHRLVPQGRVLHELVG